MKERAGVVALRRAEDVRVRVSVEDPQWIGHLCEEFGHHNHQSSGVLKPGDKLSWCFMALFMVSSISWHGLGGTEY